MMTKELFLSIFYGERLIVSVFLLWICIHYFRKGFFRFSFEKMIECKLRTILQKQKTVLEISFNFFLIFLLIFLFFSVIFPAARDLPYAVKDHLIVFEGIVKKGSNIHSQNKWEDYTISILDKDGQPMKIVLHGKNGIDTGDFISAEYLPHSKEGFLISRKRGTQPAKESSAALSAIATLSPKIRRGIAFGWAILFLVFVFLGRKQRKSKEFSKGSGMFLVEMPPALFWFVDVLLWGVGIFGGLAMFGFAEQAFSTPSEECMGLMIAGCAILTAYLKLFCRKKRLIVKGDFLRIETLFKKTVVPRAELDYRFSGPQKEKITFYRNKKRLTFVTRTYPGYVKLLHWLEQK